MGKNVSFQMVTAAEGAVAVLADKVLLHLRAERVIVVHIRHLHLLIHKITDHVRSVRTSIRAALVNVINRQTRRIID